MTSGLQFVGMPKMLLEMHFDYEPDDNHVFLGRGSGVIMPCGDHGSRM